MPSSRNYGIVNEVLIKNELNNKRFFALEPNMRMFIIDLFGPVKKLDKIKCCQTEDYVKPDLLISIKEKEMYVSVKKTNASIVHNEKIHTFVEFLSSIGVSKRCIETLLYYQYGDGTLNGTGSKRCDYHEVYDRLQNRIKEFNKEVNSNSEIVEKFIDRVIFDGVRKDAPKANALYCGEADMGVVITHNQVRKHLKRKTYDFYENIHIGPCLLRPCARYSHKEVLNEDYRHRIEVYWPKLSADVKYIHDRYN